MTRTASESFTLTSAKYLASKVTADMRRCGQLHGRPTDSEINDYGTELALLLRDGYAKTYEFGFETDDKRVLSFYYEVAGSDLVSSDDRPGKIYAASISNASWFNFLTYSDAWRRLSQEERDRYRSSLPIRRKSGSPPSDGRGYWEHDRGYSRDGVALRRKTCRPY